MTSSEKNGAYDVARCREVWKRVCPEEDVYPAPAALPAEAARALNVQRLDAPAAADVQAACATLPFFDRCRVVVVRDLTAPEEAALAGRLFAERLVEVLRSRSK